MSFSVEEALQLDVFVGCRVLTGKAGLQNEIKWANILEILDDLRHIEAGEFLITTAYGFDFTDEFRLKQLMKLFSGSKLAALAVQTGHYITEIPPEVVELAAASKIPVI